MRWHRFCAGWMKVEGLAWWDEVQPALIRLPRRMKRRVRPVVWGLAQEPAGGRIRFATDSTRIGIRAKSPDNQVMDHITRFGQMGFDVYADGAYRASTCPSAADGRTDKVLCIAHDGDRKLRQVTLYLPLYKRVRLVSIGLDRGAVIRPARGYRLARPVVYYGSSITQGGCASNAGMAFPSILSRELNVDSINLGFSGNGLSEPEMADALAEIDAACYVLDQWGNTPDGEAVRQRYSKFIDIIRASHPKTPIIVTSPFALWTQSILDSKVQPVGDAIRRLVAGRRRAGDVMLTFFDGLRQFGDDKLFATVDGIHCNTLGFYLMARALGPVLAKALGLN